LAHDVPEQPTQEGKRMETSDRTQTTRGHGHLIPDPDARRLRAGAIDVQHAPIERAKGVLMGRYLLTEQQAHAMLRRHARNSNLRLLDVANAVLESHVLLGEGRQ
jgi:hypothetical protein